MELPSLLETYRHGLILLSGHRVGLHDLLCFCCEGYSPEMIIGEFPTLPLALIHKTIGFYLENQAAVDEYLKREGEKVENQRAQGKRGPSLIELRRRMQTLHRVEAS